MPLIVGRAGADPRAIDRLVGEVLGDVPRVDEVTPLLRLRRAR